MKAEDVLTGIPIGLRRELVKCFLEIERNYRERRWEPAELNGGKFCEVVYTILKGYIDGSYPTAASKPSNMLDSCQALGRSPRGSFPQSVRLYIPRLLIFLYDIRNQRGVGHVGSIDPNYMDATIVLHSAQWAMAELVRVFHNVDHQTATEAISALIERKIPIIWEVDGAKRVLQTRKKFSYKQKTLLLLYSTSSFVAEETLVTWVEHSNKAIFRRDVLVKGHKEKLWEYNSETRNVTLSPLGIVEAEKLL